MLRSLWLNKLLRLSRSRKDRRRQAAQARRGVRPHLESLEERITPAGGLPYATAATAAQLAADITTVNANASQSYTIQLAANAPATAFQLSSALNISNTAGVTIQGNGDTLTAAANDRVFLIGSGANVILQNLTITGGDVKGSVEGVKGGGALRDGGGNVTLSKVVVEGNTVSGSMAEGGGIFVAGGGTLTVAGGSVVQSNQALGVQASSAGAGGGSAFGGGVYVSGSSTVQISDSTLLNNSAHGGAGAAGAAAAINGGDGGDAFGGGVYVSGNGWTVTLIGDTLSGNSASGGNGGNGAAGSNASGTNVSGGNGGNGGNGGAAEGGAASFAGNGASLTILNDAGAPTANPSLLIDNSAQAGSGGNGGGGGTSTGTANNANGGNAGVASSGEGGAVFLTAPGATVNIGNTTFYGNSAAGTSGGVGGTAGTGGSGKAGTAGSDTAGGYGVGGGLDFRNGFFTMVNSTVANNAATAGFASGGAGPRATTYGGGIADNDSATNSPATVTLDNNTITRNTVTGGTNLGAGLSLDPLALSPTLLNNLIAGNTGIGSPFADLEITNGQTQDNANNNFIGSIDDPGGSVSTTSNFIGNSQTQLGGIVGVTTNGKPSGGPIYFPLLPSTLSVQGGTTSALSDIAAVEGTASNTTTDEIGNPRSSAGTIDIGAVQFMAASATVSFTNWTLGTPSPLAAGSLPLKETVSTQVKNSLGAFINGGTVVFSLIASSNTVVTSSPPENVSTSGNGLVNGSLAMPANLLIGAYTIQAVYTTTASQALTNSPGSTGLVVNQAPTTLTINNIPLIGTSPNDQSVSVTANVASANGPNGVANEGTVTFTLYDSNNVQIGGSVQASVSSNGKATASVTVPGGSAAGNYTVQAVYTDAANSDFLTSSTTATLHVGPAPANISLSNVAPTNLFTGPNAQNVTAVASVASTSTVNEGTVTFELLQNGKVDKSVPPVVVNVINGQAALTSSNPLVIPGSTAAGTYTLQATYSDTGNDFSAPTPATATLTIQQSTATLALVNVSPTNLFTSPTTQNVTADVNVTSAQGTVNEGTVTLEWFASGGTTPISSVTANVSNGQAQFDANNPLVIPAAEAAGTYTLKAVYSDPTNNFIASSTSQSLKITQSSTNVALSNVAPTNLFTNANAQNVTAVANVTSGSGTVNEGKVTFELLQNGTVDSAVKPVTVNVVNNQAILTSNNPLVIPGNTAVGTYTLQATYNDASNVFVAAAPATATLTMTQSTSSVTLTNLSSTNLFTSPNTQNVTTTVDVTSNAGTVNEGKVTFALLQSGTTISSVTANVSNGQAQFTASNPLAIPAAEAAGTYTLKASYSDAAGNFVSASFSQSLTIAQSSANVTLGSVTPTSLFTNANDQNVTATANVTSSSGTVNEGTVTFELLQNGTVDSAVTPVVVNVVNGQASLPSTNPLVIPGNTAVGTYTLQATYNDASNVFLAAAPATTTLTMTQSTSSVTLTNLSSTNLFTSPNTQNVTTTVDVTSNAGTVNEGKVTFALLQSGTTISSVTANVSNGQAQFTASNPLAIPAAEAAGTYTLKASYSDPAGNFVSASFSQSLKIAQSSANVALSNVTPTSLFTNPNDQNVTADTVVSSGQGTVNEGKVTFELLQNGKVDTAVAPVVVNVVNGQASLTSANPLVIPGGTAAGTYTLQATYSDASNVFLAAAGATTKLTITKSTNNVTLTNLSPTNLLTSPNVQNVTATVDVASNAGTVNEGTVTFALLQGTTPISSAAANVSNGQAQFDANNPLVIPAGQAAGTYTLKASYSDPAGNFISASFSQTVTIAQSSANVTLPNVTPTSLFTNVNAQNVTATANVTSGSGTVNEGTVTFELLQGGTVDSAVTPVTVNVVNGQASLTSANPLVIPGNTAVGTYTLQAAYSDASNVFLAAAPATTTLTVTQSTNNVTLTNLSPTNLLTSPNVQNVTATVDVASNAGTVDEGNVTFALLESGTTISSVRANVTNGQAQFSAGNPLVIPAAEAAGTYTLKASYSDAAGNFVSASFSQSLTITQSTANVALTSVTPTSLFTNVNAQNVTATANVTSGIGTVNEGTVTFELLQGGTVDSAVTPVTVNVVNGQATLTSANPLVIPGNTAVGTYTLQAVYNDASNVFLAAGSATTTLTMTQSTNSVTLTNLSPTNLFTSPNVQNVTATVDVASNAGTVNEGTVTLEWLASGGTTPISSVTANVSNGQAQFDVNNPLVIPAGQAAGTYVLQAVYTDTAGNFVSASFSQTLTLAQSTANVVIGGVGPIDASPSDQAVNVSATILNANATVNEGKVTFALFDSNNVQVGAAVTANVSSGTTNASLTVPGDTSGGSYTLKASYTDKSGVFVASPTTATLTIQTRTATVALDSVGPITASPLDQSVNVSASVLNPNVTVNEGEMTFVLLNSDNVQIGAPVQANVSNGTANVSLLVPRGTPAGSYTIQGSYLDKSGVFIATPPPPATLTIHLASVSLSVGSLAALTANSTNQTVSVSATIASPYAAVNQGTVTFVLLGGNGVQVGAAVQVHVSNGTADASLTVAGGTPAGDYVVKAIYTDSQGVFAGSSGNGSLSIKSAPVPSPLQAALTIAFDTAALLLQNDSAALSLLTIVSQRFLGQPLPSASELLPTIEANFRYAGDLATVALQAGISIADSITGAKPASSTPTK